MVRSLLAGIYSLAVRFRLTLYRAGLMKSRRLPAPVISIGNITLGGTGKTPFTIYLCGMLLKAELSPAILSRGYRGTAEKRNLLVSNGREILCSAEESGDEPMLMAGKLRRIPVAVGAGRYESARLCLADPSLNPDIFVLDDGFQHIQLERAINLVLIDATDPFGGENLVPKGILREPLSSLRRADAFIVTRSHQAEGNRRMIRSRLNQYNPCAPVFFYSHRLQGFHPVISFSPGRKSGKDSRQSPVDPPGRRVFVLAAIGNPLQFLRDLEDLGLEISGRILPRDHHPYSQQDLDQAAVAFLNSGAEFMVTTEKDAVRLRHLDLRDIPLYSIGLELFSSEENRFREWLLERLPELS